MSIFTWLFFFWLESWYDSSGREVKFPPFPFTFPSSSSRCLICWPSYDKCAEVVAWVCCLFVRCPIALFSWEITIKFSFIFLWHFPPFFRSWGFLCPVHTPDGEPCGLLNHMTASCRKFPFLVLSIVFTNLTLGYSLVFALFFYLTFFFYEILLLLPLFHHLLNQYGKEKTNC